MKLEWNVYVEDFNSREIKVFNIFNHAKFNEDVKKALKKFDNKEEFSEEVRESLAWCYWSKCEWEVVITSWVPHITISELDRLNKERENTKKIYSREPYRLYVNPEVGEKVDVYSQVRLNWNLFVDYLWSYKRSKK